MRIVAFGTYQADAHPRIRVLIEGLRSLGHEVIEVNEPLGLTTAHRVAMLKAPWRLPLLLARLARTWARLTRRGLLIRREPMDAVLVGYLGHFDVHLARRVFPRTPIVLDHLISAAGTARDRGSSSSLLLGLLSTLDKSALGAADVIVVDTTEHAALVPARWQARVAICPVGADASWFAAGAAPHAVELGSTPLRAVFYGVYTPLQGTTTIGRALERLLPELESGRLAVTMIGAGQEWESTWVACGAAASLVDWVPWVDAVDLPGTVAAHDVALGIFGAAPKALAVVPNKVYQGAAAGCAVVTSDTAPQRRALGDAAAFVPPGDDQALAEALRALLADPARLATARGAARAVAEGGFSPWAVATPLVEHVEALLSQGAAKAPD